MISTSHELRTPANANELIVIDTDRNTIGFSIEPAPNSNDSFKYGVGTEPMVAMSPGDAGRDYGFLDKSWGPMAPVQIKVKFDGVGATPGVMVIFTREVIDPNNDC